MDKYLASSQELPRIKDQRERCPHSLEMSRSQGTFYASLGTSAEDRTDFTELYSDPDTYTLKREKNSAYSENINQSLDTAMGMTQMVEAVDSAGTK